jgi:signal transduction histidine kinase
MCAAENRAVLTPVITSKAAAIDYFHLLEQAVQARDLGEAEPALASAFELGRALVKQQASPDHIVALHHDAVTRLGNELGDWPLGRAAPRLTLPLMELTMSHGLAFREQMEQRYRALLQKEHASKLEALGTLTAGIAHDFNNIVGCILGFAEMVGDEMTPGSRGAEHVRQILIACGRARELVGRMLDYARETPLEESPEVLDIATQVREAMVILSAALAPEVRLAFDDGNLQAKVRAGAGKIEQIVMNLCLNAAEAMSDRGAISIHLRPASHWETPPGGHEDDVCLSVADRGTGMSAEVLARAFDPFFTTRAPRGSGLGLSVTQGLVTQLGGTIVVVSQCEGPDRGTEFRIFLPLADGRPAHATLNQN